MAAGMSPSKVASGAGHDEHGTKLSKMIIGIGPGSAGASGGGAAAGKVESYATASQVSVEIFVAGNGVDYPKPGQKATIHYTAFVRGVRPVRPGFPRCEEEGPARIALGVNDRLRRCRVACAAR